MLYHSARGSETYTIVGSPTIVDGVASNFSSSNLLQINNFDPSKPFVISTKIRFTETGQRQYFVGVNTGGKIRIMIFTDQKLLCNLGGASNFNIGEIKSTQELSINTDYFVKLEFTGSKYILSLSEDNAVYSIIGELVSSAYINGGNTFNLQLGSGNLPTTGFYFRGSIDLNHTYITVEGQPWFGICPIEVKKHQIMGPVGYNVVGSPTIADGVVSGFASGNYIATEGDTDFNQPFEISISCIKGPNRNQSIFSRRTQNNGVDVTFPYNNMCTIRLWLNNSVIYNVREDMGGFVLEENTKYVMKFTYDRNDRYYFAILSHITKDVLYARTIIESTKLNNCGVTFGGTFGGSTLYNPWEGSIDLNETYIKVNGKLWFWQPRETEKIVVNGVEVWTKPQES